MTEPAPSTSKPPATGRVLTWWFGLMSIAGMGFGTFSEARPFGDDVLAHPLVIFFAVVAAGLLGLRVALRRPVPEIISDRLLMIGCLVGLVAFLISNWLAVNLVVLR